MRKVTEIGQVILFQSGPDDFTVQYGLQVEGGLNYSDAAHRFGECLFHQLACEFDPNGDGRSAKLDNGLVGYVPTPLS